MARAPLCVGALALLALTSACGGTSGMPRPRPVPRVPVEIVVADPLATPWIVQRTNARVSQTVHVAAVIESRRDTLALVTTDTLQSQLSASWSSPSAGFPRRYVGMVTDYRVSAATGDSLLPPSDVALPFAFTAVQESAAAQPAFTAPEGGVCGNAHAVIVEGVRDLWLSLPDTLAPGARWRDSTRHVVCRDSIPLELRVEREFRVSGAMWRDSSLIVTVERRTHTRVHGTGRQFGDSVTITGEGTGAAMFEVSLVTGAAVFGSGESELRLTLRGSRRTQEMTQRSRISLLDR